MRVRIVKTFDPFKDKRVHPDDGNLQNSTKIQSSDVPEERPTSDYGDSLDLKTEEFYVPEISSETRKAFAETFDYLEKQFNWK
jgi:hypothetical protein